MVGSLHEAEQTVLEGSFYYTGDGAGSYRGELLGLLAHLKREKSPIDISFFYRHTYLLLYVNITLPYIRHPDVLY